MDLGNYIKYLEVKLMCMSECDDKKQEYRQVLEWLDELYTKREGCELGIMINKSVKIEDGIIFEKRPEPDEIVFGMDGKKIEGDMIDIIASVQKYMKSEIDRVLESIIDGIEVIAKNYDDIADKKSKYERYERVMAGCYRDVAEYIRKNKKYL